MNPLTESGDVLDWLLNASLQAALLVPVILLVQWLLRHCLSARWRFALWWLLILRLLLPVSFASPFSVFNYVQPQVNLAGAQFSPPTTADMDTTALVKVGEAAPVHFRHNDSPPSAVSLPTEPQTAVRSMEPSPAATLVASEPAEPLRPAAGAREIDAGDYLIPLIWAVWFLVALALIAAVTFQSIAFSLRLRSARHHTPALLNDLLAECRRIMGVRREVALLETEAVTSPVLYGFFRHRILLPWGFADRFSPVELRHVLLHELAHVKRGDLWLNWLVTALQIVHWFNPLVWLGFARLRADRELACDELALLRSGTDTGRDYGQTMLKLLEDFARPKAMPGLVGILEDKQQMRRRVRMIARFRRPSRWSALALVPITALGLVLLTDAQVTDSTAPEPVTAETGQDSVRGDQPHPSSVEHPGEGQSANLLKPIFELRLVESEASDDTESLPNPVEAAKALPESLRNLFVRKEPLVDVSALFSAKIETDLITRRPIIGIEFTAEGQARFAEVTRTHVGRKIAIVIDGRVISAPVIAEPITGGKAQITGNFSREEAERLARLINDHIAQKSAGITPFTGAIQGRVILGGNPPTEREITGMDPRSRAQHTNAPTTQFYVVADDGGLKDVVVYLEGDLPPLTSAADLPPLIIDHQRGFKMPYVSALAVGQTLLLTNSDAQLHNCHIIPPRGSGNREVNKALMRGVASPHTFTAPDHWVQLKCDVHPWEFAYVCVFPHRYFAVTDAGGNFSITNVPPGRYKLHALHRKAKGLGRVEVEITSPAVTTLGLHLHPEAALQLVCHPDQSRYGLGDEITLRCTITNISDQEQRVTWHPTAGSHLTLGRDERPWWRVGRELPYFKPVDLRPPVRIEPKPGSPLSEIILPPRTSVELLHQRTAEMPGSFRWVLAYEALQPEIITPETLELLDRQTIFSNPFTYEVAERVVEREDQASQPSANHSVEKP
jgi:beta-lactamase regulating signal transducer with metallopeptidase domain